MPMSDSSRLSQQLEHYELDYDTLEKSHTICPTMWLRSGDKHIELS